MLYTPLVTVNRWFSGASVQFWTLYPAVYWVKPAVGSVAADALPIASTSGTAAVAAATDA
jgi:hypothetical protein